MATSTEPVPGAEGAPAGGPPASSSVASSPPTQGAIAPAPVDHKLAATLEQLLTTADGGPLTFRQMLDVLGDRAHALMLLVLACPFIIIPIPGFSTLPGLLMFVLGLGVMFGLRPWLPGFVARRQLSNALLTKLVRGTGRVLAKVERLFHPRLGVMFNPLMRFVAGLSLALLAFALALPIPIPWNNGPPAIGILILALGLLERDGLMVAIGIVYNIVLWIVLILISSLIFRAIELAWDKAMAIVS
ncbi:MAG: exopolysaccharide biosynthesis protein [Kofleriaceae bacterium]